MQAFILLSVVAAAVAMPYGPVLESAWQPQAIAHAPIAYAQPVVKQLVQPVQHVVAQPVQHVVAQPVQHVVAQPQYVHAAPVIKAVAPAATSYASFSQVHVNHPAPIVKQVVAQPVYAQPIVKQVYAQPIVKQVYAQPLVKQVVAAQPVYSHNPW